MLATTSCGFEESVALNEYVDPGAVHLLQKRRVAAGTRKLLRVPIFCCDSVALPQETAPCVDGAYNLYSVLLLICRVFFSCCSSVAWPQKAVWKTI
jgi:hypothetical protein